MSIVPYYRVGAFPLPFLRATLAKLPKDVLQIIISKLPRRYQLILRGLCRRFYHLVHADTIRYHGGGSYSRIFPVGQKICYEADDHNYINCFGDIRTYPIIILISGNTDCAREFIDNIVQTYRGPITFWFGNGTTSCTDLPLSWNLQEIIISGKNMLLPLRNIHKATILYGPLTDRMFHSLFEINRIAELECISMPFNQYELNYDISMSLDNYNKIPIRFRPDVVYIRDWNISIYLSNMWRNAVKLIPDPGDDQATVLLRTIGLFVYKKVDGQYFVQS